MSTQNPIAIIPSNVTQLSSNLPVLGTTQIPSNLNLSSFGAITTGVPGGLSNLQSSTMSLGTSQVANVKNQIANVKNQVTDAKAKIAQTKAQIEKLKSLQNNNPIKNFQNLNAAGFLKQQEMMSKAEAINAVSAVVLPILMKFVNAEKIANSIINKLLNDTKKKIKDKGRVEIVDGTITFTPKDKANYQRYKNNFDNKVSRLKRVVSILKSIIDALVTVLKVVQIALAAFNLLLKTKKAKLNAEAVAANANLQISQVSYPAAGKWITDKQISDGLMKPLEDKIEQYMLMIQFINKILGIFKKVIDMLKIKLEKLHFNINQQPITTSTDLNKTLDETSPEESASDENYESAGRSYTIIVETTFSGAIQAVAYDKFSMMKIATTAPSKVRTPIQLINEIKSILG